MLKRYAVIDLGTNTFHLLIAERATGPTFRPVFRKRKFVKLGEEGLEQLGKAPFERGIQTMQEFHQFLKQYQVEQVRAIGTAALRTASNGADFLREVHQLTGITVELISGDQEAEWIYEGVKQAVLLDDTFSLIMDIGGGSVEFILANKQGMSWRQSFPVGLAVLYNRFHHHDPILPEESQQLYDFLEAQLQPLWQLLPKYAPQTLIGAAGAFEIFSSFLPSQTITPHQRNFEVKDFNDLHQTVSISTLKQRLAMEKMPASRADMIVVALELTYFVVKRAGIGEIAVSEFAMKEGIFSWFKSET